MTNFARMFDLVLYPRQDGRTGYIVRATESEVRQLRSVWHALQHFNRQYSMRHPITQETTDNWLRMCNIVVDRHIERKPLTRGAS